MPQPLIATGTLISESWKQFLATWKDTFEITLWFLVTPVVQLAGGLLLSVAPGTISLFILSLLQIVATVVTLWATLRLTFFLLKKDSDMKAKVVDATISASLFISYVWIAILVGLATLGGYILLILPGIWLGVALSMSLYSLLEDGIKGTKALSASMALVKGRWWSVFWRFIAVGFVFGLVAVACVIVLGIIVGLIGGFTKLSSVMNTTTATDAASVFASAIQYFLQSIVMILLAPLGVTWVVKLFHSLKSSR